MHALFRNSIYLIADMSSEALSDWSCPGVGSDYNRLCFKPVDYLSDYDKMRQALNPSANTPPLGAFLEDK
jgi:hypothetical protein